MRGRRTPVLILALAMVVSSPSAVAHHGDTEERAEAPPNPFAPITLYHHYLLIEEELKQYQRDHPDFFKYKVIGKSVLGLNIYAAEITNYKSRDPPIPERPVLYFDGSIHSNEQLGMEAAMDIIRWLLLDYKTDPLAKRAVDTRHTFIVPLVNPDGNVRDSRRNANDVDLNRNFPHGWGGPGSTAKGSAPASEPETRAIMAYLREVRPHYLNSFHTGTVMLLHPYGNYSRDSKVVSPDHGVFTQICREIQEHMDRAAGRKVPCGQIFSTIYPASGSTVDFAYIEMGTVAWTFEVDNEQNLIAHVGDDASLRARLGETWAAVKHAYENVERYGALLVVDAVRAVTRDGAIEAIEVTINNTGMGPSANLVLYVAKAGGSSDVVEVQAPIGPGNRSTVLVPVSPARLVEGDRVSVQLEYNKTLFKGVHEVRSFPLTVIRQGDALGLKLEDGSVSLSIPQGADSPGLPSLLVLAVVVVAAWGLQRSAGARRRR